MMNSSSKWHVSTSIEQYNLSGIKMELMIGAWNDARSLSYGTGTRNSLWVVNMNIHNVKKSKQRQKSKPAKEVW